MGLFSSNKKTGMFDKNIEPKCAYCENGKPARSKGKILCPRCGIVESDYSCKKFKYSPFLRIPERGQQAAENSAETDFEPENTAAVSESVQPPAESVEEIKETSGEEAQSEEETASENATSVTSESSAEEPSDETQTEAVSSSEEKNTETPFPAYIYADEDELYPESQPEYEKFDESKQKSVISSDEESNTAPVKAEISESESEKSDEVSYEFQDSSEYISKTVWFNEKKIPENKDIETEPQQGSFSNINNKPSDNSENIAKLESVQKPSVSSINNYTKPIEINLPNISEDAVSSIENKPQKRNAEEYLKTISVGNVSEIDNRVNEVLPKV